MLRLIDCAHNVIVAYSATLVFFYSAGGDSAVSLQLCVESGSVRLGDEQLQILSPKDANKSVQADWHYLATPYASLDIVKNSFAYRGPFIWNYLPHDIRKCATLSCFKTALKAHILNVWYVITTMSTHFSKVQLYIVIFRCLCQLYWHFIYFIIDCTVYVIYTLTCCM